MPNIQALAEQMAGSSITTTSFKHGSLSDGEIRLLQPVRIDHQMLRFQIVHKPRTQHERYTAISYAWGNQEATETIYIGDASFNVTLHLWSCLFYISNGASGSHLHPPFDYLWVDAICIDQKNRLEKNAQVRNMDQVYHNATSVSVWLGHIPIGPYFSASGVRVPPEAKTIDCSGFDWDDCMEDLADRPYWSRCWIIQEFLLAREIAIVCGHNWTTYHQFKDMLMKYVAGNTRRRDMSLDYPSYQDSTPDVEPIALPLILSRGVDSFPTFYQPLYRLLLNHRDALSSDPRDKIFSLMGLLSPDDRHLLRRFFPDYRLSMDNVRVITLGHLLECDDIRRTLQQSQFDELILALGIRTRVRKRRLLACAEDFGYLHFQGDISGFELVDLAWIPSSSIRPDIENVVGGQVDTKWRWLYRASVFGIISVAMAAIIYAICQALFRG